MWTPFDGHVVGRLMDLRCGTARVLHVPDRIPTSGTRDRLFQRFDKAVLHHIPSQHGLQQSQTSRSFRKECAARHGRNLKPRDGWSHDQGVLERTHK